MSLFERRILMKRKTYLYLALMFIALSVISIIGAVCLYRQPLDISETKLHVFSYKEINDNTIICSNGAILKPDDAVLSKFDFNSFSEKINIGDRFFARISSEDLNDSDNNYTLLAVLGLGSNQSYLSFEDTMNCYHTYQSYSITCIIFALLFILAGIILFILFFIKKKQK